MTHFSRTDAIISTQRKPRCHWNGCKRETFFGTPVCLIHAIQISEIIDHWAEHKELPSAPIVRPKPQPHGEPFVYYLMFSPTTVKIGTTRNLVKRLDALQMEVQYVVALERGGYELEQQRHLEFAADRRGRRELFMLSDRLKAHIDSLIPQRDELVSIATEQARLRA